MSLASRLVCTRCGREFGLDRVIYSCPSCNGILWVDYNLSKIAEAHSKESFEKEESSIWRYSALLPIPRSSERVSLGEGWTSLHKSEGLARKLGLVRLYLKDETTNPTGSFIDRGVSVDVSTAKGFGYGAVACYAIGNLGASVAAYAAKASLRCKVTIPTRIDLGKLYQIIAYGAEVVYGRDYAEEPLKAETFSNGYYLITPGNPYYLEGLKTTAYEICEQLKWKQPDWIIVPMGNGSHISMIWKGLRELVSIGILDSVKTRLVGVQAEGVAPIVAAFKKGEQDVEPLAKARTLAVDIGIERPLAGYLAVKAMRETNGVAVAVSDDEMLKAISLLAECDGIFAEPAATTTIAALKHLVDVGVVDRTDRVVCVITGTGLKDPVTMMKLTKRAGDLSKLLFRKKGGFIIRPAGTKLEILKLLSKRDMYGYDIGKELRKKADISLRLPTIYQHLLELEGTGLIERVRAYAIAGRRKRHYYRLTNKGKALLEAQLF